MPVELYFAPNENAAPVTFVEAQRRFADADIPCTVEPDTDSPEMHWIAFEPHSTCIFATVKNREVVFATVQVSLDDDPAFVGQITQVLESMGFDAGDPDQYW